MRDFGRALRTNDWATTLRCTRVTTVLLLWLNIKRVGLGRGKDPDYLYGLVFHLCQYEWLRRQVFSSYLMYIPLACTGPCERSQLDIFVANMRARAVFKGGTV